jgi:xanthine dehydrogenase accessory factor
MDEWIDSLVALRATTGTTAKTGTDHVFTGQANATAQAASRKTWSVPVFAVLVTVASVKGSVPRGPGTKMLVTADRLYGTIGGGQLEFIAIDAARRQLASGTPAQLHRFPLGASLGQCCGGLVNLLIEPVAADAGWVDTLAAFADAGDDFAIVTPVQGASNPGKLFVGAGATAGSLGDDAWDRDAIALAREILAGDRKARLVTLGAQTPAPLRCFVDPVLRPELRIVLFGAGHVARALVPILGGLPCRVTWVDSRDDAFPAVLPLNVRSIVTDAPEAEVDAAPAGSYFLVMTHSHPLDEALTERILARTDFAYFGLIGSRSKRAQFERRLAARGMPPERFAGMTCPIGAGGIAGKEPGIIAVAVAAQLLQRRSELMRAADRPQGNDNAESAGVAAHANTGGASRAG